MYEWEDYFEPHILDRGRQYARNGAVKHISMDGAELKAVVAGSEFYSVSMHYDGHTVSDAYCSCPYAAGGSWCKHMAAVLYEVDDRDKSSDDTQTDSSTVRTLSDLIREAPREKLEKILIGFAACDEKAELRIRVLLAGAYKETDIRRMKDEVDQIFYTHGGRGGFINYYSAFDFAADLETYLDNEAGRLLDEYEYYAAFELTAYAFTKLGQCDIDDDGEITSVSRTCYGIWKKIVSNCPSDIRGSIKEWFEQHAEDGTVPDYMEDTIKDFLKYELASGDELKELLDDLDLKIETCKEQNSCVKVYTFYYGFYIEAIELRIVLMRKAGTAEEEIEKYRRKYLNFRSSREYFMEKAQKAGDTQEEIRLLIMSKKLDADSSYLVHEYSLRLADIYHMQGETEKEKAERKEAFTIYPLADIGEFMKYRSLCTDEEWAAERTELINSRKDPDKRCELLAEERMLPELYAMLTSQEKKIGLLNKYGFLLADMYSEQILAIYQDYVEELAGYARNRASYEELSRYLKRMQQYNGGKKLVRELCSKWIGKYPTRRVMIQKLREIAV